VLAPRTCGNGWWLAATDHRYGVSPGGDQFNSPKKLPDAWSGLQSPVTARYLPRWLVSGQMPTKTKQNASHHLS
jgi:hypothetical protein